MRSDYLCNLIVPGAAKSGTSALHEYLRDHPMITMSEKKEPHHFCIDERYQGGAHAHNQLFKPTKHSRYFGESSTGYLPWPKAAERITRSLNKPKIIFLLRHPVARAFSHYRWRVRLGLEKRTLLDALDADGYGYHPHRATAYGWMAYLEFSQYTHQLHKLRPTFV